MAKVIHFLKIDKMNLHNSITIDPILKMIYHYYLFNTKNTPILANNLYVTDISSTLLYIAGDTGTAIAIVLLPSSPCPSSVLHCIAFTDGQCITLGSKSAVDKTTGCHSFLCLSYPACWGGWVVNGYLLWVDFQTLND